MGLYFLLIFAPIILGIWAQMRIAGAYRKWSAVPSRGRITGAEAADAILRKAGAHDVSIIAIQGHLTDHYDPRQKRLALSEENFRGSNLAALGVAAHEAGHAIQHKVGYTALNLRMSLIPITNFASKLLPFVIIGGFFFHVTSLIHLGILVYLVLTVFQLVTLPVEFDASRRARQELLTLGILEKDETAGVVQTLNAAGWTYVAAFVASLSNLIYLFLLSRD